MAQKQLSAAAVAQKWQRRLQAAGQDITAGVQAVTVSPGQAAAAQKQVWLANTTAAVDRWAASLQNMPLNAWQDAMINKGVPRIAAGAQAGVGKMQAFMNDWLPYQAQVLATLPARGNLEQNLQRAAEVARANSQAKGRFRQGSRSR